MKKGALLGIGIALVAVLLILIIVGGWIIGARNSFVSLQENINGRWSMVQTAYQRRADLIPNLVATVKASSDFEKSLQVEVTQARAGITSAQTPQQLDAAGARIDRAINVVFENYPQIKSTEGYTNLQTQLEGTENRIKVERDNYNQAVQTYNTQIRLFPGSVIAGMFGFTIKPYFEAQPGSETAPNVGQLFNTT